MSMSDNQKWSILQGDALKVLGTFAPNTFDAVITDPPYASGGRTQAEKNKSTARKYSSMGENAPPPFDGDAKDQRSWTRWAAEWLYEARKVCKSGAPVCMFIDWRQLPAATDALQWAGWIWRGTAVWDKGNSRPQKGRFRQQAEYIVWGSNGDMPISRPVPCLPGVFKYGNPQSRIHLTEKPLQLMRDIVKITEPGGHILDPFAGSGTTVLAAVQEGYTATGIEVTDTYAAMSAVKERLREESLPFPLLTLGRNAPHIIEQFRHTSGAVLLATGAAWEGFDFPGDCVSLLIIPRLPFAYPDARKERELEKYPSLHAFIREVAVPEMQIKLRQGFGRAIRTESDTCVIAILDERACRGSRYAQAVSEALPEMRRTGSLREVTRFLREKKPESYFEVGR